MFEIIHTIERYFSPEKFANKVFEEHFRFPLSLQRISVQTLTHLTDFPDQSLFRVKFRLEHSTQYYWLVLINFFGDIRIYALDPSCYSIFLSQPPKLLNSVKSFSILRESLQAKEFLLMNLTQSFNHDEIPNIEHFEIHRATAYIPIESEISILPLRFAS